MKNAKTKTNAKNEAATLEWLMAPVRRVVRPLHPAYHATLGKARCRQLERLYTPAHPPRRIETLCWTRLARVWKDNRPGGPVRRAIVTECRRLGYTPHIILGLHAE